MFFKPRSASPVANYFLLNQKSSVLMSFVYLAYIYVFILKAMYLISIKMNGRYLITLPAIKLNYLLCVCVFFFFNKKSLRSVDSPVSAGSIPNEHFLPYYSNPD